MPLVISSMLIALLALQTPPEAPQVKYTVAGIAAAAAIIVAVLSAVCSVIALVLSYLSQSRLQKQQAVLTKENQEALTILQAALSKQNQEELTSLQSALSRATGIDLAAIQSELSLKTGRELEETKSELAEGSQTRLEIIRSELGELAKARNARLDYVYDAHKRLYAECEPLLFQLAELAEHGYYRIYSIARSARQGSLDRWLGSDGYYLSSTIYKLIAPLVIFRLIQQRLTFVDLSLDRHIANQYRLLKLLYLTFTDAYDLAQTKPTIEYAPDSEAIKEQREVDEGRYHFQGLYLGTLDNAIDALIDQNADGGPRLKTYGRFELDLMNNDSMTRSHLGAFADILRGFHPKTRPVFWRVLWTQSLIYKQIIQCQSASSDATSRVGLAAISPKIPPGNLDWRRSKQEATDEEALIIPERVAKEYLRIRLPEVFAESPETEKGQC